MRPAASAPRTANSPIGWSPAAAAAVAAHGLSGAAATAAAAASRQQPMRGRRFSPTSNPNNCRCPHQSNGSLPLSLSTLSPLSLSLWQVCIAEGISCCLFLEFIVAIFFSHSLSVFSAFVLIELFGPMRAVLFTSEGGSAEP